MPTTWGQGDKVSTAELREAIRFNQGPTCAMPECSDPWQDLAHIEDSGMGGRPSLAGEQNRIGLCRTCHADYDQNRRRIVRELMRFRKAYLQRGDTHVQDR